MNVFNKDAVLGECRKHWACHVRSGWHVCPFSVTYNNTIDDSCPYLNYVGRNACEVQIKNPELFDEVMWEVNGLPQDGNELTNGWQ